MSISTLELPTCREELRAGQRARIMDAVVKLCAERGYAEVSVAAVLAQAKVSRGAFYELFGSLEGALVAVMDDVLETVMLLVRTAFDEEKAWRDRLRGALAGVLAFLDSQPELARVCVVEVLGAGPLVLARREHKIGELRALIVESMEAGPRDTATLAVEGVMASVVGIVHARIVKREPEPLVGLLGPLMALIVSAQLGAKKAAEIELRDELAQATPVAPWQPLRPPASMVELDAAVPALVRDPAAYRARSCLLYVADRPEASNRQIAAGIGVRHQGQVSTLLKRLASEGLLVKQSTGVGRRNIWWLTAYGDWVAGVLAASK